MLARVYKGYSIEQKNRKTKSGRWLSSATFRTGEAELSLTALGPMKGFADEITAERATQEYVRHHIDKHG